MTKLNGFTKLEDTKAENHNKEVKRSSLERMLRILDLFTQEKPNWSVDDICTEFDYTRSTGYRYTKELADAGLLFQTGKSNYSLGSRIIQWDRQLRLSDPLVKLSKEIEELPYELEGKQAWLVCRLFKDQVVCVYHFGNLETSLSYSRGIPRPLFSGATSKAILAFLPNTQHMRLFVENPNEIEKSHLGTNWKDFRANLQKIRNDGYALSISEVDKTVFGLAVPIFSQDGKIQASISCVRSVKNYEPNKIEADVNLLKRHAMKLSNGLI
ncbi:IclR family transcriptional regulator [Celerinatantimonas yamalensis]|uniref:HTH-type transcriptional repressor AllR n=1 Tax=Celerinatantimonas yamalensis TaxID=559956 RepID=A0ABW9G7H3_9GAMM